MNLRLKEVLGNYFRRYLEGEKKLYDNYFWSETDSILPLGSVLQRAMHYRPLPVSKSETPRDFPLGCRCHPRDSSLGLSFYAVLYQMARAGKMTTNNVLSREVAYLSYLTHFRRCRLARFLSPPIQVYFINGANVSQHLVVCLP